MSARFTDLMLLLAVPTLIVGAQVLSPEVAALLASGIAIGSLVLLGVSLAQLVRDEAGDGERHEADRLREREPARPTPTVTTQRGSPSRRQAAARPEIGGMT